MMERAPLKLHDWYTSLDPEFSEIADFWETLRDKRSLPKRNEIHLFSHPELALKVNLMTVGLDGRLVYTYLGGSFFREEANHTSMYHLLDLMQPTLRKNAYNFFHRALSWPCGYLGHSMSDKPVVGFEHHSLNLPLGDENGDARFFLQAPLTNPRHFMEAPLQDPNQHPSFDVAAYFNSMTECTFLPLDIGFGVCEPLHWTRPAA